MRLTIGRPTDGVKLSPMSPASYKVLGLLQKGCAYSVRGAWRFRGLRGRVKEQAFFSLLARGLAERVETDLLPQMRITPAGILDLRRERMRSQSVEMLVKGSGYIC
jgi:hypothetical protein